MSQWHDTGLTGSACTSRRAPRPRAVCGVRRFLLVPVAGIVVGCVVTVSQVAHAAFVPRDLSVNRVPSREVSVAPELAPHVFGSANDPLLESAAPADAGSNQDTDAIRSARSAATSCDLRGIYVDGDDPFNGNGLVDQQAASPGASGRYNDLQSALTNCQAGDTIVLYANSGGYVTTNGTGSDDVDDTGYHFECSGTSSHYVVLRNAAGETPVIRNCAAGSTTQSACNRDTITANGRNYIRITDDNNNRRDGHMIVYGRLRLSGCVPYPPATLSDTDEPVEVSYVEIRNGYDETGSGNWNGIWIVCHSGSWIHHNYIQLAKLTGAGAQSSAACVSHYFGLASTIEYNDCNADPTSAFSESQAGCFDDKVVASRNIYRYNLCYNATRFGRFAEGNYCKTTGIECYWQNGRIYGNLAYRGSYRGTNRPALQISEGLGGSSGGGVNGLDIYNNTWNGFGGCYNVLPQSKGTQAVGLENVHIYNNICANVANDSVDNVDNLLWWGDTTDVPSRFTYECQDGSIGENNLYRIGSTNYSTLASFQRAGYGTGIVRTDSYGFVNAAGGDFSLSGGRCTGIGHIGGVVGGASVDAGYTGVTSCVGSGCR